MKLYQESAKCSGLKLAVRDDQGNEIGKAFLFIMHNESHGRPFGLMENVKITEEKQSQGIGMSLIKRVIELAREKGCYKLIATSRHSRPKIHELYLKLGFRDQGREFRVDF